ncbi:MAG TPA: M64 family metallopeptidase [Thermoanaerobaculia bacterium]|nr:M64 family metallopeptidase [Thermoanaerobaculia bacterium]
MRLKALFLIVVASFPAAAAEFDFGRTMRVDYFHTSTPRGDEIVALHGVVNDGPWPGSRTRLVDTSNLGKYYYEVIDRDTNQVAFSKGFASVYGEWETTPEAKQRPATFHESLRFPWPKKPVQVTLKKRDSENAFQQIWSVVVDPESRFVNPAPVRAAGKVWSYLESGPASQKVDLLIIGEGYTEAEMPKLRKDVERLASKLFATEPFKSRKSDFNVRVLELPSTKSGVHRPRTRDDRRTVTGVEYNIFDSERYILTLDNKALRDAAAAAPYDFIEILVNEKQYGGGGIFNDQATSSVDSAFAEYVFVHEFGHHFAGLGDEYYTSPVAYTTGVTTDFPEPWEPNITANGSRPKWMEMVSPGTPLPTPWSKEAFEKQQREYQAERAKLRNANVPESEMDALFRREQAIETKMLADEKYANKVGAFEGASYESKGLYRPEVDCIMFTRNEVGFCDVCARAINRTIDMHTK